MRRIVVFSGGNFQITPNIKKICLMPETTVICADSGARHAVKSGIIPQLVVGDLDSLAVGYINYLIKKETKFKVYPVAKDKTDTELALEEASKYAPEEIILLGAIGTRMDHSLGNVFLLLSWAKKGLKIRLIYNDQQAIVLKGPDSLKISSRRPKLVSIIPLAEGASGVTLNGFKYSLKDAILNPGTTHGISNILTSSKGLISINEGYLLVITSDSFENN